MSSTQPSAHFDRHATMLADFEQHLDALDALGRDMSQAMRDWLSALNVHSVSFRIKSAESLTDKLARPDRSYRELWDVTDLLGLRVIVFFEALTLLDPYFEFARTTWNFSLDHAAAIDRGYSLFFVVHAHLLAQDTLRLSKVERLANLYRALDYPDDERASQRVAGLLVDQLSSPRVNRP